MIDITKLTPTDTGRYVWYYDPAANKGKLGRVKSWTDAVINIVVDCVDWKKWQDCDTLCPSPEHLTWSNKDAV